MDTRLITIKSESDMPAAYHGTPVSRLLMYHNLDAGGGAHEKPELLIVMCMDSRQRMRLPRNFAFFIRNAGARVEETMFDISFAIAVGGVEAVAVVGHTDCRMVGLEASEEKFINGLSERGGWNQEQARLHFSTMCPSLSKRDVVESVRSNAVLLRSMYPKSVVVPLVYEVGDGLLYLVKESL